jgi:uncharacterized membrane protein
MSFIDTYFLAPIRVEGGYNMVNTVTYAVIAFALLYVIFKLFKHFKVKINYNLFLSVTSFVFIGSGLRALVDHGQIARNFWTVSPGIYLFITSIFLLFVLLSKLIHNKKSQFILFTSGRVAAIAFFLCYDISFNNMGLAFSIVGLTASIAASFHFVFRKLKFSWALDRYAFTAFVTHLFDAVTTAMILFFVGGWEKHPLPRLFIENFGPFSFIPLKLFVIIPSLYIISKEVEDRELRKFLMIAIAVLGFAEGLRNLISLVI